MRGRRSLSTSLIILAFLLGMAGETSFARQIFVDAGVEGNNNGSNWANAYNSLQDALAAASSGDSILVAQGVYKPDQGRGITPGDRGATFRLSNGVIIKGGYAGIYGLDANARDINNNKTILSGDLKGDDDPNFVNNSENSYNVVTGMGADRTAVLEGVTITGGNASSNGGGVYNYRGSPTLINCTITGNSANGNGGGMYNDQSNPTLMYCAFTRNSAGSGGGGIYNSTSSPILTICTFIENSALNGGGIYSKYESNPTLTDCVFIRNSARYSGAMANYLNSNPVLNNCRFSDNSAEHGGGMRNYNSSPTLNSCTFSKNSASGDGGGINNNSSNPTLTNCMFIMNSTKGCGGAVRNFESNPILTGCSFIGNSAQRRGGGIYSRENSKTTLTNCILWQNNDSSSQFETAQIDTPDTAPVINYCCIQGWTGTLGGSGNINKDPKFTNPAKDDYHLLPGSPCLDAGDPNYKATDSATDIDGEPRVVGRVDIGADEYNNQRLVPTIYANIQLAVDAAYTGDVVVVSPGAYTGPGNRDIDFKGKAITIRSTDPEQRYVVVATIINCEKEGRGFYFHSGEDSNSIVNGLTITNGNASNGGAVHCKDSAPMLKNCIFSKNSAEYNGGGMYNENSNPNVIGCTFVDNISPHGGGGMYNSGSNPTIINSTFKDNWAKYGGGMHNREGSSPIIKHSMFSRNSTTERGGGMDNYDSSPTLFNCIFGRNLADGDGGGIFNQCGSAMLDSCTFNENKSINNGGGIFNLYGKVELNGCKFRSNLSSVHGAGMFNGSSSDSTLTSCVFSGNLAGSDGAGIYNREGSPVIKNCIFSGNSANKNGGAIFNNKSPKLINCTFASNSAKIGSGLYNDNSSFDCGPTLTNCIFWDNKDNIEAANSVQICGGVPVATYNCIQSADPNAFQGPGNIDDNPLFVKLGCWFDANDLNAQTGPDDPNAIWIEADYHLLPDSPCIDAGDPNSEYLLEPEPNGGRINIGAYGNTPEAATSKKKAD